MLHFNLAGRAIPAFPCKSASGLSDDAVAAPGRRVRGGHPLPADLRGAIIALGNFDGFHLGHQAVAKRARELAKSRGVAAIVATFDPHPIRFFRPDRPAFRLSSLDQRQRAICSAGMDAMMVFNFDRHLANATATAFVRDWLPDVGGVVTGKNFSFGKARGGDVSILQRLAQQSGLLSSSVDPVCDAGGSVSSTRIRRAIEEGDCAAAARMLTRPFALAGQLTLGITFDPGLPLLGAGLDLGDYVGGRAGLYAVRVRLPGRGRVNGLAYLPRTTTDATRSMDLFLLDLAPSDFGRSIEVELVAWLHDMRGLPTPRTLREEIQGRWLSRSSFADRHSPIQ